MKSISVFRQSITVLLLISLCVVSKPTMISAQSESDLEPLVEYSHDRSSVVELTFKNPFKEIDDSISVDVSILNHKAITYGAVFTVVSTDVSGAAIQVLASYDKPILLTGRVVQPIGRMRLTPGAHLRIELDKFGFDLLRDAPALLFLDLLTLASVLGGQAYPAATLRDQIVDATEAVFSLIPILGRMIDFSEIVESLDRGDVLHALQTLAAGLQEEEMLPLVQSYLATEKGIVIGLKALGNTFAGIALGIGAVRASPIVWDLMAAPRHLTIDVRHPMPSGPGNPNCSVSGAETTPEIDFKASSDTGQPIALSDFQGHVVLVHFWSTWAGFPHEDMASLQALYEELAGECFALLAVNLGEPLDVVSAFRAETGLTFPIVMDEHDELAGLFAVSVFPSSYLINEGGEIVTTYYGPLTSQQFQEIRAAVTQ